MVTTGTSAVGHLLFGKVRQAVLALLLGRPDEDFHLRHVVRLTGAGLGPVQRELSKLAEVGLVVREQRGRQVFYRADTSSPVYPELSGLVLKTAGAVALLRGALAPLEGRIHCAFVFGSVARGEQRQGSDVDLMIVGDVAFADAARALAEPQRRLTREVNLNVYRAAEFAGKLRAGHHFLSRVMSGRKLFLLGDDDELGRVAAQRLASPARDERQRGRRPARRHRP